MKLDWFNAYTVERKAAEIFFEQEQYGWYFDREKADQHVNFLQSELERLYTKIRPELDYFVIPGTPINKPFKKDGNLSYHTSNYIVSANIHPNYISGPFSRCDFIEPNLNSDALLKEQLFKLGWVPKQWNYKKKDGKIIYDDKGEPIVTSAKLTEDSYDSLTSPIGKDLARWLIYSHRLSQLSGIITNVRPDNTIPSVVNSCGTPTARVRHQVITNIPRVSSIFGEEMRECFTARPGRVLVGEDRSQIEARLIAHVSILILGHSRLADAILGRDFHQVIFEALEGLVTSRQAAKTPEYAFFFGAKEKKLGQSIDNKPKEWSYEKAGKEVIALMNKNIPGIIEVREKVNKAAERGWLLGLDGRKFFNRKPHAALNTYTQGNAQICCKTAMIWQQREARAQNLDTHQVGFFHDETQNDTAPEDAELFGEVAVKAIKDVGKHYGLTVPLDGEYKIGNNWKETH